MSFALVAWLDYDPFHTLNTQINIGLLLDYFRKLKVNGKKKGLAISAASPWKCKSL